MDLVAEIEGDGVAEEIALIVGLRKLGCNLVNGTDAGDGYRLVPEARAKLSASKMGHQVSMEVRAKLAELRRGSKLSEETKAKVGAASKASWETRRLDPSYAAYRAALSERNRVRGPRSEETKAKIRAAKLGKKLSAETRRRMSEAHRRRTKT